MPRGAPTTSQTKLAKLRLLREMTQQEVARRTGIPFHTYWKLERGLIASPRIGDIVNCAVVLGAELDDLIEDAWREWSPRPNAPEPPYDPPGLWNVDPELKRRFHDL